MPDNDIEDEEVESELHAITHTILNLSKRYDKADINESFFQKSIKKVTNELLRIHMKLREKSLILSDLLERTHLTQKYYQALDIINKVSSLNFADTSSRKTSQYSNRLSSSLLELPGITSKITSSFITLLDALKLEEFNDFGTMDKFFTELSLNVEQFPGLETLGLKINKLHEYLVGNKSRFIKSKNFRTLLEEDLYTLFKVFQDTLNIEA